MVAESVFAVGRQEAEEFAARRRGEAGADADMLENLFIVVQAEEERAYLSAGCVFVPAESGDDAVAVSLVLDFEHDALVGLIRNINGLRNDAVETCAFESLEPVGGNGAILRGGGDVDGSFGGLQQ